jgi:hypothetical protein
MQFKIEPSPMVIASALVGPSTGWPGCEPAAAHVGFPASGFRGDLVLGDVLLPHGFRHTEKPRCCRSSIAASRPEDNRSLGDVRPQPLFKTYHCLRSAGLLDERGSWGRADQPPYRDRPDLELCIPAARPAQKMADRNASQQSKPVLLHDVLTMPTHVGQFSASRRMRARSRARADGPS